MMRKYIIYLLLAALAIPAIGAGHKRSKKAAATKPTAQDPGLRSPAALVADLKTGEILWSRDADQPRSVASLSKLLAALVLLENDLDLDATQTITKADKRLVKRGAPTRLKTGCAYTHWDLLHAALMVSDNVAVVAMGRSLGWTSAEFASRMTERARELGLSQTRFEDPHRPGGGQHLHAPRDVYDSAGGARSSRAAASQRNRGVHRGPRKARPGRFTTGTPTITSSTIPGRCWEGRLDSPPRPGIAWPSPRSSANGRWAWSSWDPTAS